MLIIQKSEVPLAKVLNLLKEQCRLVELNKEEVVRYIYNEAPMMFTKDASLQEMHNSNLVKYSDGLEGTRYYISQLLVFKEMDFVIHKMTATISNKFTNSFNRNKK